MLRLAALLLTIAPLVWGQDGDAFIEPAAPAVSGFGAPVSARGRNLWKVSLGALAAAHVLDIQSSWGKRELNPNLAGSAGTFGTRGTALKVGMQSGLVMVECLVLRRASGAKPHRALAVLNFVAAGVIGGVAARNYGVRSPGSPVAMGLQLHRQTR
jgi:hypothetical protein